MATNKIKYGKSWESFQDDGLAKPGVFIRASDPDVTLLIGQINVAGGQCNCCPGVEPDSIVEEWWHSGLIVNGEV